MGDGICDCCDGADENEGVCRDSCQQVLKAERDARKKAADDFSVGQNKRKHELFAFRKLREEKRQQLKELEQKQSTMETGDGIQSQMEQLKQLYMMQRMRTMKGAEARNPAATMLQGLTAKELRAFTLYACQVVGELVEMAANDDTNTCVALRLAGLDLGTTWDEDNFDHPDQLTVSTELSQELANLLFDNAANNEQSWKKKTERNCGGGGSKPPVVSRKKTTRRRTTMEVTWAEITLTTTTIMVTMMPTLWTTIAMTTRTVKNEKRRI